MTHHKDLFVHGMDGWFHESIEHGDVSSGLMKVAGTYTIYTSRLTKALTESLLRIMKGLPGALEDGAGDISYFGADESAASYLVMSFEPSGIQVFGHVTTEQWQQWDRAFRVAIDCEGFPRFPA